MADQEQAARIAAMRARRGQAPIQIDTAATTPAVEVPPASTSAAAVATPTLPATPVASSQPAGGWAPPSAHSAFVPAPVLPTVAPTPSPAVVPVAQVAAEPAVTTPKAEPTRVVAAAERPAATSRTNAGNAQVQRTKKGHVAAGARILVTGVTMSTIFGLTTVIAAANRPAAGGAISGFGDNPFGASASTVPAGTNAPGSTTVTGSTAPVDTSATGSTAPVDTATGVTASTTAKAGSTSTVKAGSSGATATTVKAGTTATTVKPATPTTVKAGGTTATTVKPATPTTAAPTTAAPTTTAAPAVPATPSITLAKLSSNYHTANIAWTPVAGATGYTLQVCIGRSAGAVSNCVTGSFGAGSSQASVSLTTQTSYMAFVTATSAAGNSGTASARIVR